MNSIKSESDSNRAKMLFLGFAISDSMMMEIAEKDSYPQIAAHKLQWNIIRGIEESTGQSIDLVSAIPVSDYPRYPGIFIRCSKWRHSKDSHDYLMPFVNIIFLKHITRFLSSFILVAAWLFKNRHCERRNVLIYAMHSPYVLASILATRTLGGKAFLIIPDMPAFMDLCIRKNVVRKLAKTIDSFMLLRMIKRMSGLIVLTRYIAEDIDVGRTPFMVMEGAVDFDLLNLGREDATLFPEIKTDDKIIMYAGGLTEEYGVKLLLDAFLLIPNVHYQLWLFGKGTMEETVKNVSLQDKRIVYFGSVPHQEVIKRELRATVLVNVRYSTEPFTKYSFPSKLLEYMASGRPVITTALPGIPENYSDFLYILRDETPEKLADLLQHLCSKSPQELNEFGQRARDFVISNKNYLRQGERILKFLESL